MVIVKSIRVEYRFSNESADSYFRALIPHPTKLVHGVNLLAEGL